MRRAALCLATALLLSGCDGREIDRRDIVSALAVDRGGEGYNLLLEIADVTAGADDNPGARWLSLQGRSLTAAIAAGAGSTGRQAYLGQTQLAVVGDETAQGGIDDLLGCLQRDSDVHMTLTLAVADGEAASVLRGGEEEQQQAKAFDLARAAEQAGKSGLAPAMPLYRFISERQDEGIEGILPRVVKSGDGVAVRGAALFDGGRLAGRLDGETTQVLLMARGLLDQGVFTVGTGQGALAFEIARCGAGLEVSEDSGRLHARFVMDLRLELSQGARDGDVERYAEQARSAIESRFETLCTLLQETYGVDSLGVGRHIARRDPALWERVGPGWNTGGFAGCVITAEVNAAVAGSGRSHG